MDLDGSHIAISVGIYRAPVVTREQNASPRGDDVIVKPLRSMKCQDANMRWRVSESQDIRIVDTRAPVPPDGPEFLTDNARVTGPRTSVVA